MADQDNVKEQKDLLGQLEKDDVVVADDKAAEMKENILNDKGGTNYLGLGVHDVVVTAVELVQAKTGTMGIKLFVENEEGKSDVRMWLSSGALPYTIENISRLMVHNADEAKKEEARTAMSNIVSAKELFDTITKTLEARKKAKKPFTAFLSIREDKNGATYTDQKGEERVSLERNLLSYKPKETATQTVAKTTGGEAVPKDDIAEIPF